LETFYIVQDFCENDILTSVLFRFYMVADLCTQHWVRIQPFWLSALPWWNRASQVNGKGRI